jgi:hypothetical protein
MGFVNEKEMGHAAVTSHLILARKSKALSHSFKRNCFNFVDLKIEFLTDITGE